ncbi:MAG: ABC transporter permease [Alphaproteobacteria bacterium]
MRAGLDVSKHGNTINLNLSGRWTSMAISEADDKLRAIDAQNVKSCSIDYAGIEKIDTSGGWMLVRFRHRMESNGISLKESNLPKSMAAILDELEAVSATYRDMPEPRIPNAFLLWLNDLGKGTVRNLDSTKHLVSFLGQVLISVLRCMLNPSRIRWTSIVSHMGNVGIKALPIVGMISFLIGVVLVYQGASQLRKFGADILTVDLLAISILREIGILLTAIVVAGRSGSSFTAQIGTMKLNQEVDALKTIGLDPFVMLVLPRITALVLVLPLLTVYANLMGLLGGAIMSKALMDISFSQFINQLNQAITPWTFYVGIIKAPFFAFLIALVGCLEGLRVQGGAESVGKQTTKSVVEAVFLVIIFDAIFSIIFTELNI